MKKVVFNFNFLRYMIFSLIKPVIILKLDMHQRSV